VSEAGGPHRFRIATTPQCCGWSDVYSFWAFENEQPGTTGYYVSDAGGPHRFKVSKAPQCCGWTDRLQFYAYESVPAVPECKVELYQHGSFNGWRATYSLGAYPFHAFKKAGAHNDDQSSIKVIGHNCKAEFYQHGNFHGWKAVFGEGT
jgi:hypothetical protein